MSATLVVVLLAAAKFVNATSLNVRAEAKPTGKLVYVARIGEKCDAGAADAKGWATVKCGAFEGVAKAEFLSEESPTLEGLRARFDALDGKEDKASLDERFAVAQRMLALGLAPRLMGEFLSAWFEKQNTLALESGAALMSITPYIPRDTQDAEGSADVSISKQLGTESICYGSTRYETGCTRNPHVQGRVLPDGTGWFLAADWQNRSATAFEPYFQYHAIVMPELASALGVYPPPKDACPMFAAKAGELLGATPAIHSCKLGCAAACNEARLGCKLRPGKKGPPWPDCVKAALPVYAQCAAACATAASP